MNFEIIGATININYPRRETLAESSSNLFKHFRQFALKEHKQVLANIYDYNYLKLLNADLVIIADMNNYHYGVIPDKSRTFAIDIMCNWLNKPLIFITLSVIASKEYSTDRRKIVQNKQELDLAFKHFNVNKDTKILFINAIDLQIQYRSLKQTVRHLIKRLYKLQE